MGNPIPPSWQQGCYDCLDDMPDELSVSVSIPDVGTASGSIHRFSGGFYWGTIHGDHFLTISPAVFFCDGEGIWRDAATVELLSFSWEGGTGGCGVDWNGFAGCLPIAGRTTRGCSYSVG
jgi:hypothetical protein